MLVNLHFLSPEYLLLLLPTYFIVFLLLRLQDSAYIWKKSIDKEFLPYLLDDSKKSFIKAPIFLGLISTLMIVTLASPAYKIKNKTQSNETSEVVWVVKVDESMLRKDLLPNRLKRAVFKIDDFLSLRPDIKSSLIAYSGSAHLVMPLTKDKDIINAFASSLSPEIMPIKGDTLYEAVSLASKQFLQVEGTIIVVADSMQDKSMQKIKDDKQLSNYKVLYYSVSSEALREENMNNALALSFDDTDIKTMSDEVDHQFDNSISKQAGSYENSGYIILPFILFLMLGFFIKGFMGELWRAR